MDRKQLKAQSRQLISTAQPKPVVMAIIYLLIAALLSYMSYRLVGGYTDAVAGLMNDMGSSAIDEYTFYHSIEQAAPSPIASLLDAIVSIVSLVLSAGFLLFCLNTVRRVQASYWNIFDSFGMFFRVLWLYILEAIFAFLWALLLIIPGIVALYRYRMAIYLLFDHPEMSPLECITESKRLMQGHKGELFRQDLSFIGWFILVGALEGMGIAIAVYTNVPAFIGGLLEGVGLGIFLEFYVLPYMVLTEAGFYLERIKRGNMNSMFDDGWTPEL